MEEQTVRFCKKCLLYEMAESEEYRNVYDYIARIPVEDKAEEKLYQERLMHCRSCEFLMNGMCRKCGCFVEMRAAMKVRHCADVPQKW